MRKLNKKNQGFTIVELLVSTGIIVLISGIFLANYRSASRSSKLNLAAQQLASDIRQAQSQALGLQEFQGNIPKGGWAIHFAAGNNYYEIFADLDGDGLVVEDSGAEKLKDITLPEGLALSNFTSSDASCSGVLNSGTIIFIPPDPLTSIESDAGPCEQMDIILRDTASGNTKNVDINFLGLIDVE